MRRIVKSKMNNWLVKVATLALPTLVVLPLTTNAADLTQGSAYWKYTGFSNTRIAAMPWWEDSSVSGWGYTTILSDARYAWDAVTGATIGYSKQTNSADTYLRFYAVNDSNLNYYGIFKPYDSEGNLLSDADIDNPSKAVYKANLVMANYNIQNSPMGRALTRAEVNDVAIHELGHSLALRHQADTSVSVMAKTKMTTYGAPTTLDKNNASWKY